MQYFDIENPAFEGDFHSNGNIFWYASDFVLRLGYKKYTPTMPPINKAMSVCISMPTIITADHFREYVREINGKNQKDFKLSRFACYLVAMNSDVKKEPVARAQTYFAAFAASIQEYVRTVNDIERIPLRKEISKWENTLNSTAKMAGVESYAYFTNKGYMGLYNMPINKVREMKGVPAGETPLDYMGAEELGANIFRVTQTNAKIRKEKKREPQNITHLRNYRF
jgi:DNA-damage-inducible protein D